jgi:hypothetical protein
MTSRVTATLTTIGLAVTAVAAAAPACADVPCTTTGFSPRTVVVGRSATTRTFGVSTSGCHRSAWNLHTSDHSVYASDADPQNTFVPYGFLNSDAGPHDVVVSAYNGDRGSRDRVFLRGFYLKRNSTWQSKSFNAAPEPVKKGRAISIKARLLIANWDTDSYTAYGARTVAIQFRTPTGSYSTVKTAKTATNGWLSTTVTAKQTGVWRVVYGGNSAAGSAVAVGDAVTVVP